MKFITLLFTSSGLIFWLFAAASLGTLIWKLEQRKISKWSLPFWKYFTFHMLMLTSGLWLLAKGLQY